MAEDPVDALFSLRPEDFTAARNDLVRELRAAGERERAREVAGLRRPTVAAWAVNQAVRAEPDAYTALLDAGREVRRAQRRALSGMAHSGLREASRARREHIDRLTGAAARLLSDAGGDPAAHREDIAATFDAASASDEAGEQVGAARLERPLEAPSTFGDLAALAVVASEPEADEGPDVAGDAGDGGVEEAAAGDDEAAEQLRAATAAVTATRRRLEEAASERRRARDEAEAARRQADAAASEADDAVAKADEAAAEAERARREADRRRGEADRLRRRAEAARDTAQRRTDDAAAAGRAAEDLARELENAEEHVRSLQD